MLSGVAALSGEDHRVLRFDGTVAQEPRPTKIGAETRFSFFGVDKRARSMQVCPASELAPWIVADFSPQLSRSDSLH